MRPETLEARRPEDASRPHFLSAQLLPDHGMMLLQLRAHLPGLGDRDLLDAPPLAEAREKLDGETGPFAGPFAGNAAFSFGGAFLVPYANRIRGKVSEDGQTIDAAILGRTVRLPANWGGRRPGAERYAMHGLVLASRMDEIHSSTTEEEDRVVGTLHAGDFGGHWLSSTDLTFENVLRSDSFSVTITAKNAGDEILPIGIGWHPYFVLPSGRREQARLRVPARRRTLVNDYDEVLPTGVVEPVAGTPYDFSPSGGRPLGDLSLDDCFVDLNSSAAEVIDPLASYGLRITAASPSIQAFQVYAPPDRAFLAVEPQFNWADPFGAQWGPDVDTGMAKLAPGESAVYAVRLEFFTP